jgi:hypothetical protein
MMRGYRYLCYWILYGLKASIFNWSGVEWSASGLMTLSMVLNILTVCSLVETVTGFGVPVDTVSRIYSFVVCVIVFLLHLRLFLKEPRAQYLEKEFGTYSAQERSRGIWFAVIYILGSYILFFLMIVTRMAIRGEGKLP